MTGKSPITNEQIMEIQKKKRKRPDRTEALTPQFEPGEMSAMIVNSMNIANMGSVDMHDPHAVEERMNQFLMYCIEHDMKPTVESMALAFNTNRSTLWRWREGVETNIPEQSRNAIKKGYNIMNQLLTQTMADGKINPVAAIFLLKNNHNYRDQTDVVVTPNNPMQDMNAEDARKRLVDAIPADDDE